MIHDLYEMKPNKRRDKVLEELRKKIGTVAGVTLTGNRLTVRWDDKKGNLVEVHTVILDVDDGDDGEESVPFG